MNPKKLLFVKVAIVPKQYKTPLKDMCQRSIYICGMSYV